MTAAPLSLIVLLAAFAVAVLAARLCWRPLQRAGISLAREGQCGPGDLLFLRLAPCMTALAVVVLLVIPAFLMFEPRGRAETAGPPILLAAAAGAALIVAGLWRAGRALQATRAVTREWLARADPWNQPSGWSDTWNQPSGWSDLKVPVFVVDVPYPLVAATGIFRRRLFVSRSVLSACGDAELDAIFAHEAGHVAAADNLRRLLIRACPDGFGRGRRDRTLERAWSAAAEDAADAFALERGVAGVDLASALVAVARVGQTPRFGALASAFLEEDDVERRVRRALRDRAPHHTPMWVRCLRLSGVMVVLAAVAIAFSPGALAGVHEIVEIGVGFLR